MVFVLPCAISTKRYVRRVKILHIVFYLLRFLNCVISFQHGDRFSRKLVGLQEYTTLVELDPGDRLYGNESTGTIERGLFFIECGIMVR